MEKLFDAVASDFQPGRYRTRSNAKHAVFESPHTGTLDPEKYDDTYRKELLDLMRAKAKGKPPPRVGRAHAEEDPPLTLTR